jgi:integrase
MTSTSTLLDRKTIEALPQDQQGAWWDSAIPGFHVRHRWSNKRGRMQRTFFFQFRLPGAQGRPKIGDVGAMSADDARELAMEYYLQVRKGVSPSAEVKARKLEAARPIFTAAVERYLEARKSKFRHRSLIEAQRYLTDDYFRSLHKMRLHKIDRDDIQPAIARIAEGSGAATGRVARATINAFFSWCMGEGLCSSNPVLETRAPEGNGSRERVLSGDELKAIWKACSTDSEYHRIVRLLALTGLRKNEVGGLRWSEFDDLDAGIVTIPVERSKNRKAHTVTLSPAALAIIKSVPHREGRDHLFGNAGFVNWAHSKAALDKVLGDEVAKWTVHDIRRTVATRMGDIGILPHVIEAVLNHTEKSKTKKTYQRSTFDPERAEALAKWAQHLAKLTGDNVVRLKAA